MIKFLTAFIFIIISFNSYSAFVLNGTRVVFIGDNKTTSITVTNKANELYGGQVWISNLDDDSNKKSNLVYFIPTPTFFKIDSEEKQIIRIMKTDEPLPEEKESLFWLSVQELPPVPDKKNDENVLAIAMNTQIKLLYRPKSIMLDRINAEKNIIFVVNGNDLIVKNPTPYYFALTELKKGNMNIPLTSSEYQGISEFSPYSEILIKGKSSFFGQNMSVDAISDWGGVVNYAVSGINN